MADSDLFTYMQRRPTVERPLLGLTILVVEDSRYASEAMRLLCLRSGARIRRADSLRAAHLHLRVYRPSVVVVDLGLPDGSGLDLIRDLAGARRQMAILIATSGDHAGETAARTAGADAFLPKPVTSLAAFQSLLLAHLPPSRRPRGPRPANDDQVHPDRLALQDDLIQVAELLGSDGGADRLDYVAQFVGGLARSAGDGALAQAAAELARTRAAGAPGRRDAARIADLLQQRLQDRQAL